MTEADALTVAVNAIGVLDQEFNFFDVPSDDDIAGVSRVRAICERWSAQRCVPRLLTAIDACLQASNESSERETQASVERAVRMALGLLWNASARGALKLEMIEQGIVQRVTSDVYVRCVHPMQRCLDACVAIAHNLCEFRFVRGQRNFLQSAIVSVCVPFFASVFERTVGKLLVHRSVVHMRFMACSAIANLSMEGSGSHLEQLKTHWHQLDDFFQLEASRTFDVFNHWLSMTPFTALLCSPHAPVVRFALRALERFCRNANDVPRVFRSLALTASVDHVRFWADPNTMSDETTRMCADALLAALGVAPDRGLPDIAPPAPLIGAVVGFDRASLAAFSDITLVVSSDGVADSEPLEAHRVVLAARSTFFAALFRSQMRDATERVVRVDCERDVFVELLNFVYTGRWGAAVTPQMAVDLLSALERFGIGAADGSSFRELEFFLCHQIDTVETARALLELSEMHPKLTRLALCAQSFVNRANNVSQTEQVQAATNHVTAAVDEDDDFYSDSE
jgi:hypothetical protein